MSSISVVALYYYPVKSCGGILLDVAEIGPRGILHDREFMVIGASDGVFKTQRQDPRLALIHPRLSDETLLLTATGMQDIAVPIVKDGHRRQVTIWRDTCIAVDQGKEVAMWLSDFLHKDCRLVRMADDCVRKVNPEYAFTAQDQVGFADGYPLLLTTTESLEDLNTRIVSQGGLAVPMNRFRPSIVVSGARPAFSEDRWEEIRSGGVVFKVAKPCARCLITQTDQETAERGEEPMSTLLQFRPTHPKGLPYFGLMLIHTATGTIKIGDLVHVLGCK